MRYHARLMALGALGFALATQANAATITIQVTDAAGEGFNDPTVFMPMGGNNATTLGQARRNVFNEAARLWGLLITSNVNIVVEASFDPLTCSASSGVLGSAGPTWIFHDFVGSPLPAVFYPAALADALHGSNIHGTNSNGTPFGDTDINAQFNSAINGDATCLQGGRFYYGFDHQLSAHSAQGPFVADLLGVVLHELGHGLGFLSLVDQSGAGITDSGGTPLLGVFDQFVYDENSAMFWPQMSAAQRASSQSGLGGGAATALSWNGANVNSNLGREISGLSSRAHLLLYAPAIYDASSSVSHWDNTATPDLLMEPTYSLRTGNHTDLTVCVLYDLGWTGGHCPDQLSAVTLSFTAHAGTALNITLAASNTSGSALSYAIVAQPAHGTLTAPSGAALSYTPANGYLGADQFTYRVSEAGVSSDAAAVAIDVQAAASSGGSTTTAASSGGGGAFDGRSLLLLLVAPLVGLAVRDRRRGLKRRAVVGRR
ncbi:MAG: Ig-like domain-containing protein [Steroidobacteraceae bacterium]